jgi:hypothetical protein
MIEVNFTILSILEFLNCSFISSNPLFVSIKNRMGHMLGSLPSVIALRLAHLMYTTH